MYWKITLILLTSIACSSKSGDKIQEGTKSENPDSSLSHKQSSGDTSLTEDHNRNRAQAAVRNKQLTSDTTLTLDYPGHNVEVAITIPTKTTDGKTKTILLLHGWNLPPNEWCEKATLCDSLSEAGFYIVKPNFGKSTYQWDLYPETIGAYRKYPNRKWMYSEFLPKMQELGLFDSTSFNAAVGLSTGGRGAALFALEHPSIFKACVALSADFDHSKLIDEPINNGFYGPRDKFPDRWEGKDNIHNRAGEWKVPLYLGHGLNDKMCEVSQSKDFENELRSEGFKHISSNYPKAGHNYDYWGSETQAILDFLRKYED